MKKESLKHQAYETIKNNIVNCVYAPNTIITEEIIKEQVDASRTPIRDALSRLEQEGLIRILPKKGILITELSIRELNMLYETRNLLEPYCVLKFGNRIPQETYLSYYHKCKSLLTEGPKDTRSYFEMDSSFHSMFIENSQNSYFINMYSTIESQISRTRALTGTISEDRLTITTKEHLAIINEALKEDWEAAAHAMTVHLTYSKESYFNYLLKEHL